MKETQMLAAAGLGIVLIFMVLIMTKKATPFTALALIPLIVATLVSFGKTGITDVVGTGDKAINVSIKDFGFKDILTFAYQGIMGGIADPLKPAVKITIPAGTLDVTKDTVATVTSQGTISGVAPTVIMLLFGILYFGLMLSAGLFDPLVNGILKVVKGDPLKVLVGTAILAIVVSMDGDGTTTTLVVCSALIPVYKRLNLKMLDLAMLVILGNSVMNLLPWGGPTARIISALGVNESELLQRILPGMMVACVWVVFVGFMRGRAERKRLGIVTLTAEEQAEVATEQHADDAELARPKMVWLNLILTIIVLMELIFPGKWWIPDVKPGTVFEIAFAIALVINFRKVKEQTQIIEKYAPSALQVILMVLAAGIFMGILNGTGMSYAMGRWLVDVMPEPMTHVWGLISAIVSAPGTFLLSNDAYYYGVVPVLNAVGTASGFTAMDMAVASTVGQAFHLLSPLVGFIYLLLNLTGVDMGLWQRTTAKWAIGTFVIFLVCSFLFGGVPFYLGS
jgi:CitMHS family citrate-Mg2+:H+ or citrate-Ca2+:H+ symporter